VVGLLQINRGGGGVGGGGMIFRSGKRRDKPEVEKARLGSHTIKQRRVTRSVEPRRKL